MSSTVTLWYDEQPSFTGVTVTLDDNAVRIEQEYYRDSGPFLRGGRPELTTAEFDHEIFKEIAQRYLYLQWEYEFR